MIVTVVEAVAPAGAVIVPLEGDAVSPDAEFSCQVAVVAPEVPSVLSFATVMLVEARAPAGPEPG
jgi:hypothetical protein